ncbi:Spindle and kinetochore-associated protein [Gracilaria domingensis]|nr:Spindle and kinetochore-associated protein [Gracilaria domingensis]
MTASANAALDALHVALNSANTQVNQLSDRLQAELGPHSEALELLSTLRKLEKRLPELRQRMLHIYQNKAQLVSLCQRQLDQCHDFASRVAPLVDPSLQLHRHTAELVASFQATTDALSAHIPPPQEKIDLDPDRVASLESPVVQNSPISEEPPRNPKQNQKQRPKPKPSQKQKSKPESSQASTPTFNSSNSSTSDAFQPISKASYNRLPRNIKIRAGKLPEINAFYEKVFTFLHAQDNTPVTSKTLMAAMGEKGLEKFEVLRALAVLTATKKGWQLTYPKS